MSRTYHTETPLEALLVEQALLLARQLERTATDAPDGAVLSAVESVAVPATRELARRAVEAALQQQAHVVEKRGRRAAPVPTATDQPATRDAPNASS